MRDIQMKIISCNDNRLNTIDCDIKTKRELLKYLIKNELKGEKGLKKFFLYICFKLYFWVK
jgi:hypothetical protein